MLHRAAPRCGEWERVAWFRLPTLTQTQTKHWHSWPTVHAGLLERRSLHSKHVSHVHCSTWCRSRSLLQGWATEAEQIAPAVNKCTCCWGSTAFGWLGPHPAHLIMQSINAEWQSDSGSRIHTTPEASQHPWAAPTVRAALWVAFAVGVAILVLLAARLLQAICRSVHIAC